MWEIAARRRRPIGPPARPAILRASSGRPPASASLGQSADVFWLAGHTGLAFYIGVSLRGRTTGQYARARGGAAEAAAAACRLLPLELGGAAAERQTGRLPLPRGARPRLRGRAGRASATRPRDGTGTVMVGF